MEVNGFLASLDEDQRAILTKTIPLLQIPGRKCRLAHEDVERNDDGTPLFPFGRLGLLGECSDGNTIVTCAHLQQSFKMLIYDAAKIVDSLFNTSLYDNFMHSWIRLGELDSFYHAARIGYFTGDKYLVYTRDLAQDNASVYDKESDAVQGQLEQLRIDLLSAIQKILNP
jgi:hypothetical protein